MPTLQFGNVSADMRAIWNYYGLAEFQAFVTFLTTFYPVSQSIVVSTATNMVVRLYDYDGDSLTISATGDLLNMKVATMSLAGAGVTVSFSGDFLLDAMGNVSGRFDSCSVVRTAGGALLMRLDGLSQTIGSVDDVLTIGVADAVLLSGDDTVVGGAGGDFLLGYAGNDVLAGNGGDDTLNGGPGADRLSGGPGNDVCWRDNAGDVVVELAGQGRDLVHSSLSYALAANVENLTLVGGAAISGTGNAAANAITGNAVANALSGLGGNDTLVGSAGNDTLNGGLGLDTLKGGTGNDRYVVNASGDVVVELAGQGVDTVASYATFALPANVEQLILLGTAAVDGTGNALANRLTGNAAANVLDGGTGNDTLVGALGNDTYAVDGGDSVSEAPNAGYDTVRSSVGYVLPVNVEKLMLAGTAVSGVGNALDNAVVGSAADNVLYGAAGNDLLYGGAGDDVYVVNGGDTVTEAPGAGTDRVNSSVTCVLSANVENLLLTGTAAVSGAGNALGNAITGNGAANGLGGAAGADTLDGGLGNDTLTGGADPDVFLFASAIKEASNVDTIVDFAPGSDEIRLRQDVFDGLPVGELSVDGFAVGTATTDAHRIVYDDATGALYYDADGSGAGPAVQFAVLGSVTHPTIDATDFVVV